MIKPKFRVGDSVLHCRSGQIFKVLDCRHNKTLTTTAIKVRGNGSTSVEPTTIDEYYAYKLNDGKYWRFAEDLLQSAAPCPNCNSIGWDWATGCGECGLTPEDAK